MRRKLSLIGILFMLLKHPPLPEFSGFSKTAIVEVRGLSTRQVALGFHIN